MQLVHTLNRLQTDVETVQGILVDANANKLPANWRDTVGRVIKFIDQETAVFDPSKGTLYRAVGTVSAYLTAAAQVLDAAENGDLALVWATFDSLHAAGRDISSAFQLAAQAYSQLN